MNSKRDGNGLKDVGTLLRVGTVAGWTDGQLLEGFGTRQGEASALAFAGLVERHGPMVLRTCRSVLGNEHDALDAFQATFLILVRRGETLWVRDSIGPWLHRVALRVASRARRDVIRRRDVERKGAEAAKALSDSQAELTAPDEIVALVHEEIDRLPDRFRVPVLLCDMQGRTHEEAARHLGCPVGTVKSRLFRGRDRLRDRLIRRGVAPGAAGLAAVRANAAVPTALADATVAAALGMGAASASVLALAEGACRGALMTPIHRAASILLVAGAPLAGLAAVGVSLAWQAPDAGKRPAPRAAQEQGSAPAPVAAAKRETRPVETLAWRRTDVYVPPDFDRFFPDDPEGATQLKALWNAPDRDQRPDAEILRTVRQGLRRVDMRYQTEAVRWVGSKYVWGKSPQNSQAIEIMYHASGAGGESPRFNETRNWAVYFGLSTVQPKTPPILRALAELCLRSDDPNDLDRVAWGAATQREAILAFVKPHLDSPDPARREKAALVAKILKGEVKAFQWAAERTRRQIEQKFKDRLPEIKRELESDQAGRRRAALELVLHEGLTQILEDSDAGLFLPLADEADPELRRGLAQAVGARWIWRSEGTPKAEAVALELKLARDPNLEVRRDALYYGLSRIRGKKGEEIVRVLLGFGLENGFGDMAGLIAQGLADDRDEAAKVLDEAVRGNNPGRAQAAREVYHAMTGKNPPPAPLAGDAKRAGESYSESFRALYDVLAATYPNFALKGIDWHTVGAELLPLAGKAANDDEFGLLVERLVARLEDSHAVVLAGSARLPAPELPRWDPGLACLIDDRDRPVVYAVDRGSPAEKAGIRPGQALISIDEVPAASRIEDWMRKTRTYHGYSSERTLRYDAARGFVRQANRGTRLTLVLEDPEGRRSSVEVEATVGPRDLPRLPVPRPGIQDAADVSWGRLEGELGYLVVRRIPNGLEAKLDAALRALGSIRGLILDLRGNSGGGFDTSTAFGNFEPTARGDDRPCFKGPIALLIDARTISAGEGWASWFVARRRARLFGSTSAGASCRKTTYTLTDGRFRVVIPVKAYTGFLDRPIERLGLVPDVAVRCRASDLARGTDTVIEAAADWLRQASRAETP